MPSNGTDTRQTRWLERLGGQRFEVADDYGQPLLTGYRLQPPGPTEVRTALGLQPGQVRFGEAIGLSGVALTTQPGGATVDLMWTALMPLERDWTVFVHFVDDSGKTAAQADGEPLGASYPTRRWQPGERVIETRRATLLVGQYRVQVGWYDRTSGERLAVPNSAENAVEVGTVVVPPAS